MCRIGLVVVVILSIIFVQDNVNADDILDFPYMVAILFREWRTSAFRYRCNGVIISNRHVLTTATCIGDNSWENNTIKVRVGSTFPYTRGQIHTVAMVRKHFKFSPDLDADIAVLTLSKPLKLSYRVAVVKIPEQDAMIKTTTSRNKASVTYYTNEVLKRCTNSIQFDTTDECNSYFRTKPPFMDLLTENMLCLLITKYNDISGQDVDSLGAPLVINGVVYGMYSWGRWEDTSYKVFTRVSAFSDWIKNF